MRMMTNKPIRKLSAATLGGAVAILVIWGMEQALPTLLLDAPVKDAITLIVVFAVGYFTPPDAQDVPVETAAQRL